MNQFKIRKTIEKVQKHPIIHRQNSTNISSSVIMHVLHLSFMFIYVSIAVKIHIWYFPFVKINIYLSLPVTAHVYISPPVKMHIHHSASRECGTNSRPEQDSLMTPVFLMYYFWTKSLLSKWNSSDYMSSLVFTVRRRVSFCF